MMDIEVFSKGDDQIGEGPLWSADEQALYWLDIGRKSLNRRGLADLQPRSWKLSEYPGCLAELSTGGIAVAMGQGVHELDLMSGATKILWSVPAPRAGTRFNDGKVDPGGRFWAGTMQNNFAPNGGEVPIDRLDGTLYRFDGSRGVQVIEDGIGIPNTLAWSPDLKKFYFGDSLEATLFVYDFDADSGLISAKRTFHHISGLGVPDGSAMDVDGCLWNARWDGGAVVKITAEGKIDNIVELPVPRPTSCSFGGPDQKTLFVTSATNGLSAAQLARYPLSGSIFGLHGVGQGVPVPALNPALQCE